MSTQDHRRLFVATLFVATLVVALGMGPTLSPALAEDGPALKPYNAAITDTSVSGISSGAFMAVQFGTAWSSVVTGAGVVAGGPYFCAQASASDVFNGYTLPIMRATGDCMTGPPPDLDPLMGTLTQKAASGEVDALENVARQKVYIYHGYNDAVVARSVTDATAAFYRRLLGDAHRGNLFYQTARGAGHSFVVTEEGSRDLGGCPANEAPFIDQCGYDQAGVILQHIYGALREPAAGGAISPAAAGAILAFDQNRYTAPDIADAIGMGDEGYVFVPRDCADGAPCRVHVALHGCLQDAGSIGRLFVERTGYNAWAAANHIIVLYPQTKVSSFLPFNPQACWDWWSYVDHDDSYVTKSGRQIKAIKAMLDALTAGAAPAPVGDARTDAAIDLLRVTDVSTTGASLAWTAMPSVSRYGVWRAEGDGAFSEIGTADGPSFADQGLSAETRYRWRIAALLPGRQGPPSAIAEARTLAEPPDCDAPGTCRLGRP